MNKNTLEVFGYVRVSTENQLENYSIEEQTMRIRSYCQAKGWHLIKIYTDGGYSGGNINRPALQLSLIHISFCNVHIVFRQKQRCDREFSRQKPCSLLPFSSF